MCRKFVTEGIARCFDPAAEVSRGQCHAPANPLRRSLPGVDRVKPERRHEAPARKSSRHGTAGCGPAVLWCGRGRAARLPPIPIVSRCPEGESSTIPDPDIPEVDHAELIVQLQTDRAARRSLRVWLGLRDFPPIQLHRNRILPHGDFHHVPLVLAQCVFWRIGKAVDAAGRMRIRVIVVDLDFVRDLRRSLREIRWPGNRILRPACVVQ